MHSELMIGTARQLLLPLSGLSTCNVEAYSGLAAAVMEKLVVSTAKVSIQATVKQKINARLGKSEPGQINERRCFNGSDGARADADTQRCPKQNEEQTTEYVSFS